jgi:hypothetical protein
MCSNKKRQRKQKAKARLTVDKGLLKTQGRGRGMEVKSSSDLYQCTSPVAVPGADSLLETWKFPFISHSQAWLLRYLDLVLGTLHFNQSIC